MNRYCKECKTSIEFPYGEKETMCPVCKRKVELKDTIAMHTVESRITQLKAMHELMCEANDEEIYFTWIYLMPDCPSEYDFFDIAVDDEGYNECFDLFVKLIAKNGNRYQKGDNYGN